MTDDTKLRNYEKIMTALRGVRGREEGVSLRRGIFYTVLAVIGILLAAAGLEALFRFGIEGRTTLFILSAAGILASVVAFIGPPLAVRLSERRRKSEDAVALQVGAHFPSVKDRLLNAMQVFREMRRERHVAWSPGLVDAGFRDVADAFEHLDLTPVVDTTPAKRAGRSALIGVLFAAALFAMLPGTLGSALSRVVQFGTDFAPPAPFDFVVEPGDREAVKGEELRLTATTTATKQPEITFHLREEGQEEFDPVVTVKDSSGIHVHTIPAIRGSVIYYAEAAGYRSRQFRIDVVDRPFVRSLRVRLTFPSYTKLPPRYLDDNVGDVTALAGTRISLELAFNKEIADAALVFNDSARVQIETKDERAQTSFLLTRDASWHITLRDASGIENANPIEYTLKVVPDMIPVIDILEPGANTDLDESMRLALISRIRDDYGFSKMVLKYRLAASRYEKPHEDYSSIVIPLPSVRELEMEVPYIWNLTSLNLVPEDVVNYYVEIYDNDVINGPKVGRSQVFSLRLPSLEEVFARADSEQEEAIENLEETLKAAEDVQRELDKLQQEMKQQNAEKLDWQQQKKLEDLMKRQEEMLKDVKNVNEQINRLKEDMQKQNLLSEETLRKYEELNQLMKEVDAPELQEARKKMEELMRQMSPDQMKKAMEDFKFNEETFRQSIERTIDLLKRIQIEQKVEEIARRAEELAKQQEDLAERTQNANPQDQKELDRLAEEQRELQKQMEAMQREMSELQKKMEQFPQEMPLDEMQQAQNELNEANMQQSMSQSASQCQGGNCQNASSGMKKTAEQMRKFQKKMENVKKKLNENVKKMVQRAFQKALKEVLEMSKRQEELKNQVQQLPINSPQYREATREQMHLMEQLNQTGNELMELAKKTFAVNKQMAQHLGKAMKKMQEAMQSMENRDQRSGGEQQGGAMAELNEAAKQLSDALQQSSQSGSSMGGSLLQQLRQMAQQQMDINANMPTPMDGQMSQQERQQLQRLMMQQAAMQKSLEQLNEEAKRSDEGKRLVGDLERIAEDMQEVVRDMQQDNVNPNTRQKQERILSRLLDASRSMRERDWEKRRRSRTGEDVARSSPSALDENALDPKEGLRYDLQKAVNEGYARDYEVLIRKYFERLEEVVKE
ncbi:MAG: DUF4175 family protein [Bacteroidetes bacterium]|nr:DUF4175 family protein [Bacteroidota bacterium]